MPRKPQQLAAQATGHRYTRCERWPTSRCKSLWDKFPTELSRDAINVRMEWSFQHKRTRWILVINRLHLKPKSNKNLWTLEWTWCIMFQSCKHLWFLASTVIHFVVAPLYFVWFPNSFVHVETALSSPAWDSVFFCATRSVNSKQSHLSNIKLRKSVSAGRHLQVELWHHGGLSKNNFTKKRSDFEVLVVLSIMQHHEVLFYLSTFLIHYSTL